MPGEPLFTHVINLSNYIFNYVNVMPVVLLSRNPSIPDVPAATSPPPGTVGDRTDPPRRYPAIGKCVWRVRPTSLRNSSLLSAIARHHRRAMSSRKFLLYVPAEEGSSKKFDGEERGDADC